MNALPRPARWYLYCLWTFAGCLILLTGWWLRGPYPSPLLLLAILVAFTLADHFEVAFGVGKARVGMTVVDALVVFLVPTAGPFGILPILTGTLIADTFSKRPWYKGLFNAAQRSISFIAMLWIYRTLSEPGALAFSGLQGTLAFVLIAIFYHSLNTLMVSTIVALSSGQPPLSVYGSSFRQVHWIHFITLPFGAILAYIWQTNPWLIIPASVPLFMAQRSFKAMASWQEESSRNQELADQATRLLDELRTKQDELVSSSKLAALGTFAAGIAHEFNNLLAAILGYSQLALTSDDVREKDEALEVAMRACLRGRSITSGLLTFARRSDSRREACDLAQLVAETVILVQREFAKAGVTIEQRLAPVPTVLCDPGQIAQVLINLLTNARDAMAGAADSRILIELRASSGIVELAVTDSGSGIAEELLPHIFQPFTTTKGALGGSTTPGTGLGLAISHGIIESHSGSIQVRSTVGLGTTMTVRLPAVEAALAAMPAAAPAANAAALRILVVDDEPDVAEWLRRQLQRDQHFVAVAHDAPSGLRLYREQPFDLVLCDVVIPGMNGVELVRRLRAFDPHAQVLAMTGHSGATLAAEMLEVGALAVLTKPFSAEDLQAAIRHRVDLHGKMVGAALQRTAEQAP
jgi:signal transduction histidine kinase/ActR/RegA family two-component response regulator